MEKLLKPCVHNIDTIGFAEGLDGPRAIVGCDVDPELSPSSQGMASLTEEDKTVFLAYCACMSQFCSYYTPLEVNK